MSYSVQSHCPSSWNMNPESGAQRNPKKTNNFCPQVSHAHSFSHTCWLSLWSNMQRELHGIFQEFFSEHGVSCAIKMPISAPSLVLFTVTDTMKCWFFLGISWPDHQWATLSAYVWNIIGALRLLRAAPAGPDSSPAVSAEEPQSSQVIYVDSMSLIITHLTQSWLIFPPVGVFVKEFLGNSYRPLYILQYFILQIFAHLLTFFLCFLFFYSVRLHKNKYTKLNMEQMTSQQYIHFVDK